MSFLFQERNDNCNSNTIMLSDAKECFTWIWCFEQDWSCSHGSSSFSSKFRSWSRGCDCPCWSGHGHVFRSTPGCMINIAITNLFAIFYFKCLCLCLRSFHSPIKVPPYSNSFANWLLYNRKLKLCCASVLLIMVHAVSKSYCTYLWSDCKIDKIKI